MDERPFALDEAADVPVLAVTAELPVDSNGAPHHGSDRIAALGDEGAAPASDSPGLAPLARPEETTPRLEVLAAAAARRADDEAAPDVPADPETGQAQPTEALAAPGKPDHQDDKDDQVEEIEEIEEIDLPPDLLTSPAAEVLSSVSFEHENQARLESPDAPDLFTSAMSPSAEVADPDTAPAPVPARALDERDTADSVAAQPETEIEGESTSLDASDLVIDGEAAEPARAAEPAPPADDDAIPTYAPPPSVLLPDMSRTRQTMIGMPTLPPPAPLPPLPRLTRGQPTAGPSPWDEHTAISDPPSAELLASMAAPRTGGPISSPLVAPRLTEKVTFPPRELGARPDARIRLTGFQLGSMLIGAALLGGVGTTFLNRRAPAPAPVAATAAEPPSAPVAPERAPAPPPPVTPAASASAPTPPAATTPPPAAPARPATRAAVKPSEVAAPAKAAPPRAAAATPAATPTPPPPPTAEAAKPARVAKAAKRVRRPVKKAPPKKSWVDPFE